MEEKDHRPARFWNIVKLNAPLKAALLSVFSLGLLLLILASKLEEFHLPFAAISHEIGVLCVTITPILFIYELALRRLFVSEMSKEMDKVINKGSFRREIFEIIKKSMPKSYDNILTHGISDAYDFLDSEHLKDRIRKASHTEIRMQKIWIPSLNEALEPDLLIDAVVERGCSYKIILCDPDASEAISKRSRTLLGYDSEYYIQQIKITLKYLQNIWRRLDEKGEQFSSKLEVKLHDDFIPGSLVGFKNYYILGVYLHSRVATRGMQIKIDRGVHTKEATFFKELDEHFNTQWAISHKTVRFYREKEYELIPISNSEMSSLTDGMAG